MPSTISLTEKDLLVAVRDYLVFLLPPGTPVIRAQINRVPEPGAADFALMTPVSRTRLGYNIDTYQDDPLDDTKRKLIATRKVEIMYQIDVHGPSSAENAQIIATMFTDHHSVEFFGNLGIDAMPTYANDAREIAFDNAEAQVEMRWIVEVCIAANIDVAVKQDFADQIEVGLIPVDLFYPY